MKKTKPLHIAALMILLSLSSILSKAQPSFRGDRLTIELGNLILHMNARVLKDVIVHAEKPQVERQMDKTVVNVDNILTAAGSTVLEMVQKLPGVQMTTEGLVTLNGKSGVQVLLDGKPSYLSAADLAALLNGMPSSAIQKIEIMTNPSSKYDAAGTGGILNIIRKKNRKDGWNGSVNGSLGQTYYGRYSGGFGISYKNNSYNLYLNNNYTYNKTLFNRTVITEVLNAKNELVTEQASDNDNIDAGRSWNPSLGLDLTLSKRTTLSITGNTGIRSADDRTLSTMDVRDSSKQKTSVENFTGTHTDRPFNYTAALSLEHRIDSMGREIIFDLDYSDYSNRPHQNNHTITQDAGGNFIGETHIFLDQHRQLNIYAARADYVQPFRTNGRMEAGWKSSYVKAANDNTYYNQVNDQNIIDPVQSDYSVNTENINAGYLNLSKQYKKLSWQAGIRAEQTVTKGKQWSTPQEIRQNYLQVFPTLFFDYKFNAENGLASRLGRRTDRASYSEMVPFRRPQTPTLYFQGNPNLRPEITWHGELTYSYHAALFVTFGYDITYDFIRTLPYLDSNKITTTRIPTNIRGAHSWNVDLVYSHKLTRAWSTDNTVSFYQNSFTGRTSDHFSLDNKGIPSIYLSMNNSFRISDPWSAECTFQYYSKRQLVTSSFGAYSILNLGIKRLIFHTRGTLTLNANNVFQSESHNAIDLYESLHQYSYWNFYTRSIRVNFSYRFGTSKMANAHPEAGSADEQKRAGN